MTEEFSTNPAYRCPHALHIKSSQMYTRSLTKRRKTREKNVHMYSNRGKKSVKITTKRAKTWQNEEF